MKNPNNQIIITTIFILLLMCVYAVSGANAEHIKVVEDKILYNDVREVKNDTEQYCFIKILIKEKDGVVSKEEELYCSDGRKGIDTPSYWELFAQFYYRDVATPNYCRYYSRKNHAFKSYGKVCLNEYGEWKVK
jgi:hypothetical protein